MGTFVPRTAGVARWAADVRPRIGAREAAARAPERVLAVALAARRMGKGELATLLEHFDLEFAKCLDELASDGDDDGPSSSSSSRARASDDAAAWPLRQRVGNLCFWLYESLPRHVAIAKLIRAGDALVARGEHEIARRRCYRVVAECGLLDADFEAKLTPTERRGCDLTVADKRRTHVAALLGIARCDHALGPARDASFAHPQTLAETTRCLDAMRDACQLALQSPDDSYFLALNATVLTQQFASDAITAGFGADVVEYLIYATLATEYHVLLSAPKYLPWRVDLVGEVCRCYEDCGKMDEARKFIARAEAQVKDLKDLEAMDPVPQTKEQLALYAEADRKLRVLAVAFAEAPSAGAIASGVAPGGNLVREDVPEDAGAIVLAMLHDPKRRVVTREPPEPGSRAEAATTAAAEWIAPRAEAMTTWLEHAAATRAAAAAKVERELAEAAAAEAAAPAEEEEGEKNGEGAAAADEPEPEREPEREPAAEGDDAEPAEPPPDPTIPPPDLDDAAIEAYERARRELPAALHAAILRRLYGYEAWEPYESLSALAKLRVAQAEATGGDDDDQTGMAALETAANVLAAIRVVEVGVPEPEPTPEDDAAPPAEGDDSNGEPTPPPPAATTDAGDDDADPPLDDPECQLATILRALPPSASDYGFSDVLADAALLLYGSLSRAFTDDDVDGVDGDDPQRDERRAVHILEGVKRAFDVVDFDDATTRVSASLRLCVMLERASEEGVRRAAIVASEASDVAERHRAAVVLRSRGEADESTRTITAEAVWSETDGDARTPSGMSETDRAFACLHADVVVVRTRLALHVGLLDQRARADAKVDAVLRKNEKRANETRIFGVKSAWDLERERDALERADRVPAYPPEVERALLERANKNPWERAIVYAQMAALRPELSDREELLERAGACLLEAEAAERSLMAAAMQKRRAPGAEETEAATRRRVVVPDAPAFLSRARTEVTIAPPSFSNLKHAIPGQPAPVAVTFAVLAKEYGGGLEPGEDCVDYPNAGVEFPVSDTTRVTIGGLTPNESYNFAVVAYDANGEVIHNQGRGTDAIVTCHPLPSTPLWSMLAVAASRLGCGVAAKRASGVVHARFVSTAQPRELCEAHPMSSQRLRRDAVADASFPTMRAAARALLVAAESATASRRPERGVGDPPPLASVPEIHDHVRALVNAKTILLAMELASYHDDAPLLQEGALRAGNCLAPLLTHSRRSKTLTTALSQCLTTLRLSGAARAPAVASLAASLSFQLASIARACGEDGVLEAVAGLDHPSFRVDEDGGKKKNKTAATFGAAGRSSKDGDGDGDAAAADGGGDDDDAEKENAQPTAPELSPLTDYFLGLPEWPRLKSAVVAAKAESSPALAKIATEGAKAAYDAFVAGDSAGEELNAPEYLRTFSRIADAAAAQGAASNLLAEWTETTLARYKAAVAVAVTAHPASVAGDEVKLTELPEEEEARVAALEAKRDETAAAEEEAAVAVGAAEEAAAAAEAKAAAEDAADDDEAKAVDEAKAAVEAAKTAAEDAKVAAEAAAAEAEGAREKALEEASGREKAARTLTRRLPPIFARRKALIPARESLSAGTRWHAAVRTTAGLVEHEAAEKRGLPEPEPEQEPAEGEGDGDGDGDGGEEAAAADPPKPPTPPVALAAMTSFARACELASRVGHHDRLMNAIRSLLNLTRSRVVGAEADVNFYAGGGARLLHVAASRLLEHVALLKSNARDEAPLVKIDGGAGESPLDGPAAAAREEEDRRRIASEPEELRAKPAPWFQNRPLIAPDLVQRFVVEAARACAAVGHHHRASKLLVEVVDVLGTDDAARACLPAAISSSREAGEDAAADAEEIRLAAAKGELTPPMRALLKARAHSRVFVPERWLETRELQPPPGMRSTKTLGRTLGTNGETISRFRTAGDVPPPRHGTRSAQFFTTVHDDVDVIITTTPLQRFLKSVGVAYGDAAATAKTHNDRETLCQSLLELGDVRAREGDVAGAVQDWSDCLDELTGCYKTIETAGCASLPPDAESRLRAFGLWGCARGACAAAKLAKWGATRLDAGKRLESARLASALFAAPFCSTIAHSQRALDLISLRYDSFPELWIGVEVNAADMYRFDAKTVCDLALASAEIVLQSGRALEAIPAACLAEHLASFALFDVHKTVKARTLQATALADVGQHAAAADRLASLLAGAALPSVAGGPRGRVIVDAAGAAIARLESIPVNPKFDPSKPLGAGVNQPIVRCLREVEMRAEVAALYGADLVAEVELSRANWLSSLAVPAAEWRSGGAVDPAPKKRSSKPGDAADAPPPEEEGEDAAGAPAEPDDPDARDGFLRAAEEVLRRVVSSTEADIATTATAAQATIDAAREKRAAARAAREEKGAAARARRETAEKRAEEKRAKEARAAEAARMRAGAEPPRDPNDRFEPPPVVLPGAKEDDDDAEAEEGGEEAAAEEGGEAKAEGDDADADAAEDGSTSKSNDEDDADAADEDDADADADDAVDDADDEDVVGEDKHPWVLASPAQLSALARASDALSVVLRAMDRSKDAFEVVVRCARSLESFGDGVPRGFVAGGATARKARDALARAGHSLWLRCRARACECLLDLSRHETARAHADAARAAADRLGDRERSRVFIFIATKARAALGDVAAAAEAYDELLAEMTTPQSPDERAHAPPTGAFFARVAGTAAELALRRGDAVEAERKVAAAVDVVRADAKDAGVFDTVLAHPAELMNVHIPCVNVLARLLCALGHCALARRGGGEDGESEGALVGRAKIALEEAADLCGRVTVRTHAGLHAKIALLRAHAHRRAMYKRGAASGAPVVDDAERDAAREACARGIRWAAGEDAPHDRATIRALLLELAACDVPEAMREAADARAKEEEEEEGEGEGEGETAARSPLAADGALAAVAACLRDACFASRARDVLLSARATLRDDLDAVEWPAWVAAFVDDEEAARDAERGSEKLENADLSVARRALAAYASRAGVSDLASGHFDGGGDDAHRRATALHRALLAGSAAYKKACCFEKPPIPKRLLMREDKKSGADGEEGEDAAAAEEEEEAEGVVTVNTRGAIFAQWHRAPAGGGLRGEKHDDVNEDDENDENAPPAPIGGKKKKKEKDLIVLMYVITPPIPPPPAEAEGEGAPADADEETTRGDDPPPPKRRGPLAGELVFDAAAVRAMRRVVQTTRRAVEHRAANPLPAPDEEEEEEEEVPAEGEEADPDADAPPKSNPPRPPPPRDILRDDANEALDDLAALLQGPTPVEPGAEKATPAPRDDRWGGIALDPGFYARADALLDVERGFVGADDALAGFVYDALAKR